jgi:hypothetical protein
MSWSERLLGAAVGALVVGVLAALVGVGPNHVGAGLLAVAAATFGAALIDAAIESQEQRAGSGSGLPVPVAPPYEASYQGRTAVALSASSTPTPNTSAPSGGPSRRPPAPPIAPAAGPVAPPVERDSTGPAIVAEPLSADPPPRQEVKPPDAVWVDAGPPIVDSRPDRWEAHAKRDLMATYLSDRSSPDAICTHCGRTLASGVADPAVDCPFGDGGRSCSVRDRDDILMTIFRSVRRVSNGLPKDPSE